MANMVAGAPACGGWRLQCMERSRERGLRGATAHQGCQASTTTPPLPSAWPTRAGAPLLPSLFQSKFQSAFSVSVKVSVSLLCFSRSKFQNELAAGDVILTADCNHAIEIMMAVLASPGANVLLPRPGYPTYEARAALCGLEFRHFNLMPEKGTTWARPRPLPFPPCLARSPPRSWSRHARLGGSRCGDGGGTCLGVNDWIYFHPHAKCFVGSPSRGEKKAS
ncbi:hypothetical protein VPH35_119548 [Triticum aestivum]